MKNRILCLILLAAMLFSLAACSGGTDNPSDTVKPTDDTIAPTADTEPAPPKWKENEVADIADPPTFNGRSLGIICQHNTPNQYESFLGSEDAKTILGMETYSRDTYLMDTLDITFHSTSFYYEDLCEGTEQLIMSGDLSYDFAYWNTFRLFKGALWGLLFDLNELPYVNLNKAYWATQTQETLSIAGHQFMAISDFTPGRYASCECIAFNMQVLEDYHLDNPFDIVARGDWTFDTFINMSNAVHNDVNGNGAVDPDLDTFGFYIPSDQDTIVRFYSATGSTIMSSNDEGLPQFNLTGNMLFNDVWEWCAKNLRDSDNVIMRGVEEDPFMKDQALFAQYSFAYLNNLRDMESDFGILPSPKWNNDQTEYYTTGGVNVTPIGGIFFSEVPEAVGAVLELGSAYGYQNIIPIYFDNDLKIKIARNPESSQMIQLILDSAVYDMARLGFWYETYEVYRTGFNEGKSLSSLLASKEKSINKKISDAVEDMLDELEYRK